MSDGFKQDRFRYRDDNQTDIYNPEFNSSIKSKSNKKATTFKENLNKFLYLVAYFMWYPDIFLDMMTPKGSHRKLNTYQRLILRCLFRFKNTYIVLSRGSAKTFTEVLALFLMAIFYPQIRLSVIAETKEQASKILQDKYKEIVEWFPFFANEIKDFKFGGDYAIITFQSGSVIDILGNVQQTKGLRRHRISVEESARLNNSMFKDAVEPVVQVGRTTMKGTKNPKELNGQINFFTTASFRGTTEYLRNLQYLNDMANLQGKFLIGAGWELPVFFGLYSKKSVMDYKNDATTSPIAFQMNFESRWVGAGEGALINIEAVQNLRFAKIEPILHNYDNKSEIYISMDVARSETDVNNRTVFIVFQVERNKNNNNIKNVNIVNIISPPNGLTFSEQTIILKKLQKKYKAKKCIVDGNGLGSAIIDECARENEDIQTGEMFDCWSIENKDITPEVPNSPPLVYSINGSSVNHECIVNLWDYIDTGRVRFLPSERFVKEVSGLTQAQQIEWYNAYVQTDRLLEELSNLKVSKAKKSQKFTVEQVTKKIDKDRYSALIYGLWYIQNFENGYETKGQDYKDYMLF